jgi:hypothetical protein
MHGHSFYVYSIFIPNHHQPHNPFSDILIPDPNFPHQTIYTQISLTGGGLVGSRLPSFNMQAKAEGSVFQTCFLWYGNLSPVWLQLLLFKLNDKV